MHCDYLKDAYILESQGQWAAAAVVWRRAASTNVYPEGKESDLLHAAACQMIHDATQKGDRFRARVEELKVQAGKCPHCGEVITEDEILRQADKEIYG
jgi:Mn-dependent DtxR family transcriptional regulator